MWPLVMYSRYNTVFLSVKVCVCLVLFITVSYTINNDYACIIIFIMPGF